MLLQKTKEGIVGECHVSGLVKASFTWPAEAPKAKAVYEGPCIDPDVWAQVLAFFKWTHTEYKSESQVRLYANPTTKQWRAWAFPQEADTGMTARELKREETAAESKVRWDTWGTKPSSDWYYFGTAHHHCGCSAFQSGTDEANEKGQDGIHITVGNLDSNTYDIDYRFYLGGVKFDCPLTMFWDVGEQVKALLPENLQGNAAKFQMGRPKEGVQFPAAWKENVIKLDRAPLPNTGAAMGFGQQGNYHATSYGKTWMERIEDVVVAIIIAGQDAAMSFEEIREWFENMETDPVAVAMFKALKDSRVDFEDLERYFPNDEDAATKLMVDSELEADLEAKREEERLENNKRGNRRGKNAGQPNGETDQQEFRQYMD
jgi:hypothetical protein